MAERLNFGQRQPGGRVFVKVMGMFSRRPLNLLCPFSNREQKIELEQKINILPLYGLRGRFSCPGGLDYTIYQ